MEVIITHRLMDLLMMGITFSVFEMALVQKLKMLPIFNKKYQIWLLNLLFSFLMGIPFTMYFFEVTLIDSIWVSFFGFIGAPTLYSSLKKQNLINYTPKSASTTKSIPLSNSIER
ncbi:MAG: hypothetical protein RR406_04915 [Bacilli bacterium]